MLGEEQQQEEGEGEEIDVHERAFVHAEWWREVAASALAIDGGRRVARIYSKDKTFMLTTHAPKDSEDNGELKMTHVASMEVAWAIPLREIHAELKMALPDAPQYLRTVGELIGHNYIGPQLHRAITT